MTEKVKRRLITVLCADVHGYARLMEADEVGTLARLRRYRAAMAALVERHDGRIVNTWGDAVIAEFASVIEAVQCAVEIQQELSDHDRDLPEALRMRFRIGINLGDVMVEGADIYGDGVNIAARLQELAEPGGILISGPVYDQVHNKLSIGFDCLGWQQVKNVAMPVMSYRVTLSGVAAEQPALGTGVASAPRPGAGKDHAAGVPLQANKPALTKQGHAVWTGFTRLPRPIASIIVIAGFLFLINVFSGLDSIWFHWPVAPLLLIVALWAVFRSKPAQRENEKRRMDRQ
jgi:adenylate cyclase